MDWTGFIGLRDFTAARRSFTTMPEAVMQKGFNGEFTIMSWPDPDFRSVEDITRRVVLPPGVPPKSAFFATYLPLARADLMIRLEEGKAVELALYPEGGPLQPIGRDHPALREIGPASLTRAAHAMLPGGSIRLDAKAFDANLREALRLWPGYGPALVTRGMMSKLTGDAASARLAFEEACASNFPDAFFYLGDHLHEINENARALEAYDRAVELGLGTADLFCQRAMVLRRLGREEAAWASSSEALKVDPHHVSTLVNLAGLRYNAKDPGGAISAIQNLRPSELSRQPAARESALSILARVGMETAAAQGWRGAARCFELMAGFDPRDAKVWSNWGVCLLNLGALRDAEAKLRRAVQIDPAYEKPRGLLESIRKPLEEGFPDGTIAQRSFHTIRYVDSRGRETTLLNFIVKAETKHCFMESEVTSLSLERDKDLLKLLVAKGHNARVWRETPEERTGFFARLTKKAPSAPVSGLTEGRPISFFVPVPPSPEFTAFAEAWAWHTTQGKRIESAPVDVLLHVDDKTKLLTQPERTPEFHLKRELPFDEPVLRERFYPVEFSQHEED